MAASDKSERDQAVKTRHMAALQAGRYAKLEAKYHIEWPGHITPEWDRLCKIRGKKIHYEAIRDNLGRLLGADAPNGYSVRNVGFDHYGDLVVDGDWIADLGGNGDELCMECARAALLSGDLDPMDAHVCYSYIQDVEHPITCNQCGAMIRLGCYCLMVVAFPRAFAHKADTEPREWDRYGDQEYGASKSQRIRKYQGGEEEEAIAYAREVAAEAPDCVVQVRYLDPTGDTYNNEVLYDSRTANVAEAQD